MVIEEVLEIDLIIEFYIWALLEEKIVEDVYDGLESSVQKGVYERLDLDVQRVWEFGLLYDFFEDYVLGVQVAIVEVFIGTLLV